MNETQNGWTTMNGQFNATLRESPGVIHPDSPGARVNTYLLRKPLYLPAPIGLEEDFVTIPEKVITAPYWRAVEMQHNGEGTIITEEEARPYLERQAVLEKVRALEAAVAAEAFISEAEKAEKSKMSLLETRLQEQSDKIDALIKALGEKGTK